MTDKQYVTKIVAASLLGDGSVGVPPDGSVNAKYRQPKTVDHMDYVNWLSERLSTVTTTNQYEWQPRMPNAKRQVMLQTRTHPFYTSFRNRMYPNGHKVVDPHYLTLIDWEFMAVWYQEDGSTVVDRDYVRPIICTDCFSYGDNHHLRQAVGEKLGIDLNVASYRAKGLQKYRLRVRPKDINKFMDGIEPYVAPSFSYKICRTVGSSSVLDEDIVRSLEESKEQIVNDFATSESLE